jgi:sarcosine oxidase subunit gamma
MCENPGLALASVALLKGAGQPGPLGLNLPGPGGWVQRDKAGAFWTGPGQWMITLEGAASTDFAAQLRAQAPGCAVTEQTDGWAAFDISAPDLTPVFERLVNLDLSRFPPGSATRTTIEHMGVYVIHRGTGQGTILGMRSAAGSLWHALNVVAKRLS